MKLVRVYSKTLAYIPCVSAVSNSGRDHEWCVSLANYIMLLHYTLTTRTLHVRALPRVHYGEIRSEKKKNKKKKEEGRRVEAREGTNLLTCGPGSPGSPFFPFFPLFPGGPGSPGGPVTGTNNKSIPRDGLGRQKSGDRRVEMSFRRCERNVNPRERADYDDDDGQR